MVCDLLRAAFASCEQLPGNGVISGLQIFHAPSLAWRCLHSGAMIFGITAKVLAKSMTEYDRIL